MEDVQIDFWDFRTSSAQDLTSVDRQITRL